MKNIFLAYILLCCIIGMLGCKKDNDAGAPPPSLTGLKSWAGYGEAFFTWGKIGNTPADSTNFLYTSISYEDETGRHEYKFSRFTDTAVISGLTNRSYTFDIKTVGPKGAVTPLPVVQLTPNPPVFVAIAKTLQITASIGGAKVTWTNNSGKTVNINVAYTDQATNKVIAKSFTSAEINGVAFISGIAAGSQVTLVTTVSDQSNTTSDPVTATITPLVEAKLSNTTWSIAGFSSQEAGGEGPVNGYATAAIDGNINTFWHTEWSADEPPYPHWIAVNMGREATISRVGLVNRQNKSDGETEIQLMGSTDGINWINLGTFPFQQKNAEQIFSVAPQTWKYIKVVLTKGPNNYGFLAEINLYGA